MSIEHLKTGDLVPKPPEPRSEVEIMAGWKGDWDKPLVSILCITYNHAPYIADALNGFLMQETDFPFEIIVHDDASTDGAQAIIKEYQAQYPGMIRAIYQEENQYSKGRRALGFFQGLSDAEYLAVCEGDDYWLDAKKLQKQVHFLQDNQNYVITGHDAVVMDEQNQLIKHSKLPDTQKRDFTAAELAEDKAWILTMSWVYRNVVKDFAPERNMVRNGDNFFISLLGQYGKSHFHSDIQPAAYRVHPGGVWSMASQDSRLDEVLNTRFWMYRYYERVGERELAIYYRTWFRRSLLSQASGSEIMAEILVRLTAYSGVKLLLRKILGEATMKKARRFKNWLVTELG